MYNLSDADSGFFYCGAVYAIGTSISQVEVKVSCANHIYTRTALGWFRYFLKLHFRGNYCTLTIWKSHSKIINFLEPLKPFIAILVEVIILVAAILLYERNHSKKNNTAGGQWIPETVCQDKFNCSVM